MSRAQLPVVIAGQTCAGKSSLALSLADALSGALVCADSRQVYDGLRIASAGPDDAERARAPHHLFGVVDPRTVYDAGRFVDDADRAIEEIAAGGRRAILVGGTGMYLRAWRHGLDDVPAGDPTVRRALDDEIAREGLARVHARLAVVDPESAARISPHDRVRVVRALEVFALTGSPASALRVSHGARVARREALWILVEGEVAWLAKRIAARATAMFAAGLVDEARALRARLGADHALTETLGVREALAVVDGRASVDDAIAETALRTRQYARRQRKWFAREDGWTRLDARAPDLVARALDLVARADAA